MKRRLLHWVVALVVVIAAISVSVQAPEQAQAANPWTSGKMGIWPNGVKRGSVECSVIWTLDGGNYFDNWQCKVTDARADRYAIWAMVRVRASSGGEWTTLTWGGSSRCVNGSGGGTKICLHGSYAIAKNYQVRIDYGLRRGDTIGLTLNKSFTMVPNR